ncbi:MAG: CopG family transcriptional regulator [Thermoleophilaceae bacterium]
MRTTVTLDPDVEAMVKRAMRDRGLSFKEAVNEAIRAGMVGAHQTGALPALPAHDMGEPLADVTKALRLAGELEDQELAAKFSRGA